MKKDAVIVFPKKLSANEKKQIKDLTGCKEIIPFGVEVDIIREFLRIVLKGPAIKNASSYLLSNYDSLTLLFLSSLNPLMCFNNSEEDITKMYDYGVALSRSDEMSQLADIFILGLKHIEIFNAQKKIGVGFDIYTQQVDLKEKFSKQMEELCNEAKAHYSTMMPIAS